MAERQFGPYRLIRQVAVGGMAEIHLAKTKGIAGFEKYVALKMIHPNFAEDEQFIQMLVDEAKIAVQLTHGNIAQTFDLGRVGDTYYITMEYVDGADLYKILRRGSEQDIELPLDVCAFVAKEIASALDHAHRKRDHGGKPLGIVHRDVSPQNVLVSYAGEVKLVDFGIAKATMKVRQTAVGVIKGKYYYMSPEQAWGDKLDFRSDIFSAGIVLYEMITGQMLYLEEDLQKLLDMARKADIAPPSSLRKGVPPQLEKIVMHALEKVPGDRYQSAGDLATDLERFLHTYSPVFTASKIAALMRKIVGDPMPLPDVQEVPSVEVRDGAISTHPLDASALLKARDELRDENSVIFRVDELQPPTPTPAPAPAPAPKPGPRPRSPSGSEPTKTAKLRPLTPNPNPSPKLASIAPSKAPAGKPVRPRHADEETRELGAPQSSPHDEPRESPRRGDKKVTGSSWDGGDTFDTGVDDELESLGEHTTITSPARGGNFLVDAGDDSVDATVISQPPRPGTDTDLRDVRDDDSGPTDPGDPDPVPDRDSDDDRDPDDDEGPTVSRDFMAVSPKPRGKAQPPALAARIHAPAVSELRRPKASRRTPPGGSPVVMPGNLLQQIVGSQPNEPMPVPVSRPSEPALPPAPSHPPVPSQQSAAPPPPAATPGSEAAYVTADSGMPFGIPASSSSPGTSAPGVPAHLQSYQHVQGIPPGSAAYQGGGDPNRLKPGSAPPATPPQRVAQLTPPTPAISPTALYDSYPYRTPHPRSLTGQMRVFEADELPERFVLGAARRRWFMYVVAGLIAVSVAAGATFFIIRTTRDGGPLTGSVRIETVPPGAEIVFDGTRLTDRTPYTIEGVPVGSRHELRLELPRHKGYLSTLDVPKTGGEVPVSARLEPVTGKIVVNSQPGGAEIRINGQLRGQTPTTLNDVDMESARTIELRLGGYAPVVMDLTWPNSGQIALDIKLER